MTRGCHAANTIPTDTNMRALPDDGDAVHELRRQDEVDTLGATQLKVRFDHLWLRLL
jgi:hypothetical protein